MAHKEVNNLLRNISEKHLEIDNLQKTIMEKKKHIIQLQKQLWDTCSHTWVRDPWANFDDLCKYNCSICGLWKDRSMYT